MTSAVVVTVVVLVAAGLVTSRVRSERRNRILNESITNNMPSGVVTVDEAGRITFHNPAAQRIFGSALGTGIRLSDLVVASDRLGDLIQHAVDDGDTFTREEFDVRNSQTGARQIGMSVSPISGSGMRAAGALCILSDLTEVVRLQRELRLKENFAALGEMSTGITHEFKNALATISGYAQMLEREPDPERARAYAREIFSDTRRLTRVVSELLQLARPVDLGLGSVALDNFLEDTLEELRRQRPETPRIEFAAAAGSIVVRADETLLRQAILNVLINAVEATVPAAGEPEPTIHVSLDFDPDRGGAESGRARIHIRDDGPGIPPDALDKVLIPFFTTKPEGSGLGLSLVHKIAIAHGGAFEIRNRAQRGAEAVLSLPAVAAEAPVQLEPSGFRPE